MLKIEASIIVFERFRVISAGKVFAAEFSEDDLAEASRRTIRTMQDS